MRLDTRLVVQRSRSRAVAYAWLRKSGYEKSGLLPSRTRLTPVLPQGFEVFVRVGPRLPLLPGQNPPSTRDADSERLVKPPELLCLLGREDLDVVSGVRRGLAVLGNSALLEVRRREDFRSRDTPKIVLALLFAPLLPYAPS